jgi:hypothetical protein
MEQRVSDLAGDHVGLVAVGHGDDHVGILGAGADQYVRVRTVADDGANIQTVLQLLQYLRIAIDDRDVVELAGEIVRDRGPDLAGAENDDLHIDTCKAGVGNLDMVCFTWRLDGVR